MNYSLYVLGNPNGYDQYPLDANNTIFQNILNACGKGMRLSILRKDQLVQYVYVRKIPGKNNLYLGFVLVVTGIYCTDCNKLIDVFDCLFYDVISKGSLICCEKGNYRYVVDKFIENHSEIKRISVFLKTRIEQELIGSFDLIPLSFQVGNGDCTLFIKDDTTVIGSAIEQFDVVNLINNDSDDKAVSEQDSYWQKPTKIFKSWLFWVMMLVILLLVSIVIASTMQYKSKLRVDSHRYEIEIKRLDSIHQNALDTFKIHLELIGVKNELTPSTHDLEALEALKNIENAESNVLFQKTGRRACLKENIKLYEQKLRKEKDAVSTELANLEKDGLSQGDYPDGLRKKLSLIECILEQLISGCVVSVDIEVCRK